MLIVLMLYIERNLCNICVWVEHRSEYWQQPMYLNVHDVKKMHALDPNRNPSP